jgi:hypothetical protein
VQNHGDAIQRAKGCFANQSVGIGDEPDHHRTSVYRGPSGLLRIPAPSGRPWASTTKVRRLSQLGTVVTAHTLEIAPDLRASLLALLLLRTKAPQHLALPAVVG